jgi:hypothetical protein
MTDVSAKWKLLEACPIAEEVDWLQHAAGFAAAFVVPHKRERWTEMLTRRPRRITSDSHKLHGDLERRVCSLVDELTPAFRGDGLFYDFFDSPRVVPAAKVEVAAGGGDAIFSLIPGKLAVFFFHEGEMWLCQA